MPSKSRERRLSIQLHIDEEHLAFIKATYFNNCMQSDFDTANKVTLEDCLQGVLDEIYGYPQRDYSYLFHSAMLFRLYRLAFFGEALLAQENDSPPDKDKDWELLGLD